MVCHPIHPQSPSDSHSTQGTQNVHKQRPLGCIATLSLGQTLRPSRRYVIPLISHTSPPILLPEYPFAKYNVPTKSFDYSQDEYAHLLDGPSSPPPPLTVSYPFTDNEWTKEETDYLFSLVHEYDLRWYVIHDRYDYPHGPVRAIEVTCVDAPSIHPLTSRVRTSKTAITAHAASSSEIVHGPATSRQSPSCSTVTSSTRVSPPSPVDLHPSATHTSPM